MKTTVTLTMTALLLALSGTVSQAEPIYKRQVRQQKRIYQGIASGQVTPREAVRLEREQARIECVERKFRSDGKFTPREMLRTQRMLNHASRHIFRAKHNRRAR